VIYLIVELLSSPPEVKMRHIEGHTNGPMDFSATLNMSFHKLATEAWHFPIPSSETIPLPCTGAQFLINDQLVSSKYQEKMQAEILL
jgi:hypothetical protein